MAPAGRLHALERGWLRGRRDRPFGEIDLRFWEFFECARRYPKILREQPVRRMADPVGDAECSELGEIAVVENENEVAGLVAERLDYMRVAARKIPDVARPEIVGLGATVGVHDGRADTALDDIGPFGGGRVPVQFPHHAGLHPHRDAGESLRDWQLLDCRLLAVASVHDPAFRRLEREFEGRQLRARGRRIGQIVLEARVSAF